jgi:hypothetical protein
LVTRHGPLGAIAKRVVERMIRFYTHRQEIVNRTFDERLARLEAAPIGQGDAQVQLRAQYAALSARLTQVQRESSVLRAALEELRAKLEPAPEPAAESAEA